MRRNCCHISLGFVLKLLSYLQAFVGVSILLYSLWMLSQWNDRAAPPGFPPPAYPPGSSAAPLSSARSAEMARADRSSGLELAADVVSRWDGGLGLALRSFELPAPWFIYSFMGLGIVLCCVSLIGCIAAEALNGCCLCFYTLLVSVLLLLEAALVAFIAIDHHWEQILPSDPTGELDSLRSFIESNIEMCEWIGIAVVVVQGLSLLLSFVLRALASPRRADYDGLDGYDNVEGQTREPLLNHKSSPTSGPAKSDVRGGHSGIWSSLVREKYGLNNNAKFGSDSQNASGSTKTK
ncbi:tetraspanin-20 [Syzygium oleosum]|uniref:tetraspanin-20 n=1 Tax=Syzygium oleosum TaxID=219896 RepID=UPI0024B9790D|nr:tetraspanin-20 [Syzygium oleosum]